MFAAASTHPAVKPLTSVPPAQVSEANQVMPDLVVRLLTRSCEETARKAFRYEGNGALPASMQVLGQVAGRELFAHPDVAGAMADLEARFDRSELEGLLQAE